MHDWTTTARHEVTRKRRYEKHVEKLIRNSPRSQLTLDFKPFYFDHESK